MATPDSPPPPPLMFPIVINYITALLGSSMVGGREEMAVLFMFPIVINYITAPGQ